MRNRTGEKSDARPECIHVGLGEDASAGHRCLA